VKKIFSIAIITLLIGISPYAGAAETPKLGYVDLQEALYVSDAGKKAVNVVTGEKERLQKELDKKQNDLKKMGEEIEKQGYLLSDETRSKKEKEYQEELKNLNRFFQDSRDKLQEKERKLTKKIIDDLLKIIEEVGKEKGYTFIFEKNESRLLYSDKAVDLTDEVVKRYNVKSK